MYRIDFTRIKPQLTYLWTCLDVLQEVRELETMSEQFAAARALHMAIECVTEIGTALIDGFMMRDPGSYEDIVQIMKDEAVLPQGEANRIKRLVEYRRTLVVHYTDLKREKLMQLMELAEALETFPQYVAAYLKQELGESVSEL